MGDEIAAAMRYYVYRIYGLTLVAATSFLITTILMLDVSWETIGQVTLFHLTHSY
jgi:hypothetical protein